MFKIIAAFIACYVVYSVLRGEVFIKSGVWGKSISREESPTEFWFAIVIYTGLAIAVAVFF